MPLFAHAHVSQLASIEAVSVEKCMFCDGELLSLKSEKGHHDWPAAGTAGEASEDWSQQIKRCKRCGWWLSRSDRIGTYERHVDTHYTRSITGSAGCLKQLDVGSPQAPIDEIRSYLMGRYEARHHVDEFHFEDVVGSVYADLGYQTIVTNRRGDDGIDVFLRKDDETIGVQVKRSARTIGVNLLRDLSGALTFKGITKGVFVTTSTFTSGAPRYVEGFKMRGQHIELVDADAFYSALEIAQVRHLEQYDDEIRALAERTNHVLVHEDNIAHF